MKYLHYLLCLMCKKLLIGKIHSGITQMTRKEDEGTDVALLHDDQGLSEAGNITFGSRLSEQKKGQK